jgi:hypothetical protein
MLPWIPLAYSPAGLQFCLILNVMCSVISSPFLACLSSLLLFPLLPMPQGHASRLATFAQCQSGQLCSRHFELFGRTCPGGSNASPTNLQISCLANVLETVENFGKPDPGCSETWALVELCLAKGGCTQESVDVAPYCGDLVSWPPSGSAVTAPTLGLEGRLQILLEQWRTCLLRDTAAPPPDQAPPPRPYRDPSFQNKHVYSRFLLKLKSANMIKWRRHQKATVGIFFVLKKSGQSRIIIDTRCVNYVFESRTKSVIRDSCTTPILVEMCSREPFWPRLSQVYV